MGADENGSGEAKESTARRDELIRIQENAQGSWATQRVFEVDAPAPGSTDAAQPKYMACFPYPYMNGVLHVGHAFSLSKVEFATAFHRLCQKLVLFPQGYHCTGMPIKACADKLKGEIEQYGNPPVFPEPAGENAVAANAEVQAASEQMKTDPLKFSAKKSKAAAKQGTAKTQWNILRDSGIPEDEISSFSESLHWLYYFPPIATKDITAMGCGVDWRRSFVTTDVNPYYDSFIRWQFNILREQGKIVKAKRYSVYSPKDGQPCADHDRASGEGGIPQEYLLCKMRALELPGKLKALEGQGTVFLMAATLRPETMAGQTNCWVLPDGDYGAFRGLNNEIYIMHPRSARNLSFQDATPIQGKAECLLQFKGHDLIGVPLKAPKTPYERIYVLPLLTILTSKGTAVVTSVPSDSPDDYAAFMDLKNKPAFREKFGIKDEWILPFEILPVLSIPGYGDSAAKTMCEKLKIKSQNQKAELEIAKKEVYLKGFTDGIMAVGKYKGEKVSESKDKHKADLLSSQEGILYSEPDRLVMSRSGDECVVALTDQWYLNYGEPGWLSVVEKELEQMNLYSEDCKKQFDHVLSWLHEWACSRSFGLGSRVPWDPQYLIESLSDSTIYMAYYTVSHVLQRGDIYGKDGGAVKAEDMTDAMWSHIFLDKEAPGKTNIPTELIQRMRNEFNYWYPFDLRASGKDLIQNHLTFCLYIHAAIWDTDPAKWPRSIRCNGHLMLNHEKMSKSTGNFLTLRESIQKFGADAVRVALADAGDSMDDANFEYSTANSAILRLTKELAWIEEVLQAKSKLRHGKTLFADRAFENEISILAQKTKQAYENLLFREALKHGWFELQNARDTYRVAVGPDGMEADVIMHYIEVSTLLLTPICPHTCHHIWTDLLQKSGLVMKAGWPQTSTPDLHIQWQQSNLERLKTRITGLISKEQQAKKKKAAAGPPAKVKGVELYVAKSYTGWQASVLRFLQSRFNTQSGQFSPDSLGEAVVESVKQEGTASDVPANKLKGLCIPFARVKAEEAVLGGAEYLSLELPFDESKLIEENREYLLRTLKIDTLDVRLVSDGAATASKEKPEPGHPAVVLFKEQQ